ncbi:helix-turn-helix transcriptional regulator [Aestuariicoccus sp. MJ-SS9]|uniref:helix-turn-helix domain-containing protein n=1 Tax=Aestuariicoccus sp. MJ-SS9 TaxID=3079855 RepID=UPI00290C3191|nr:helix-turn-helix transcriptional regulator [Aestuariicoccus sp. MJ-SS9]MDU8912415.1 helix-turn-helix transcriptional regulator [Aestuariicoccus sp. MJ-SS9]
MDDQTDWYGPDSATFGDRVAAAREATGMTQEELAKRLGVKLKTLQSWEDDMAEPRANRLSMMAGLLNVSMMWLLTGEGEGLGAPEEEMPEGLNDVLIEMRAIKSEMSASAARLGRLEKKLRGLAQSGL